jgi:hypothetical protein
VCNLCGKWVKNSSEFNLFYFPARSKVFSAMFKHDTIERRSQSVIVPDVPESTMERMLEYVYSGSVKLTNDVGMCVFN